MAASADAGVSLLDRLMAAVASDPRVAVPVDEIAPGLAIAERLLVAPIREAMAKGWLSVWDPRGGDRAHLTLSAGLAASLGREVGRGGKWRPIGTRPGRHEYQARSLTREASFTDLYGEHALTMLDRAEAPAVEFSDTAPAHLIGQSVPWPVERLPDGRCGACGDRAGPRDYCLWCSHPLGSVAAKRIRRAEAQRQATARTGEAVRARKAKAGKGAA